MSDTSPSTHETATLAGGCFWCLEAVYDQVQGVESVESGYTGGETDRPTYEQVCGEMTGHAEAVKITFDPAVISYRELLEIFFTIHDPTTLNRQGNDVGTQYRSIILYSNEAQKMAAEKSKAEMQKNFSKPIVTQIVPLTKFYKAESYHQNYYNENSEQPYCSITIRPKIEKLEKKLKATKPPAGPPEESHDLRSGNLH